jgi:hypothetical protein
MFRIQNKKMSNFLKVLVGYYLLKGSIAYRGEVPMDHKYRVVRSPELQVKPYRKGPQRRGCSRYASAQRLPREQEFALFRQGSSSHNFMRHNGWDWTRRRSVEVRSQVGRQRRCNLSNIRQIVNFSLARHDVEARDVR